MELGRLEVVSCGGGIRPPWFPRCLPFQIDILFDDPARALDPLVLHAAVQLDGGPRIRLHCALDLATLEKCLRRRHYRVCPLALFRRVRVAGGRNWVHRRT